VPIRQRLSQSLSIVKLLGPGIYVPQRANEPYVDHFGLAEHHTSEFIKQLFADFAGFLQADASSVYNILEHGRPKDSEEGVRLLGCFAHLRRYLFEAAICRYQVGLQGLLRIRN